MQKSVSSAAEPKATPVPRQSYGRNFVLNLAYGMLGALVRFGTGMFLVAYLLRKLGTARWGLVVVATSVVSFLALIQLGASAGLGKKLNTYLTRCESDVFQQYFTAGVLLCVMLGSFMVLGVALTLTVFWSWCGVPPEMSTEGRLVLGAVGLATMCTSLCLPFSGCLQAVHRIDIDAKLHTLATLLRAGLSVLLFELTVPRASTYAFVLLVTQLMVLVGVATWVHMNIPAARVSLQAVRRAVLRDIVAFNILTLFNSLNYILFMQSPALVLHRCGGLATAGLYGVGLQLNNLVRGFLVPGANALRPVAVSFEASAADEQFRALFRLSTKCFVSTSLLLWVGFVFLRRPFLTLWLSGRVDLEELISAMPWLIGASACGVAALPASIYLVALERLRLAATSGVVLAAAMVLTMVWMAATGTGATLVSISIALAVFFGLYQLLRVTVVVRAIHLSARQVLEDHLLRPAVPVGGGILVLLTGRWIGEVTSVAELALTTALTVAVFGALGYVGLLNRGERAMLARLITKCMGRSTRQEPEVNGRSSDSTSE